MKRLLLILFLLPPALTIHASVETIAFTNGRWFDGKTFRDATFYSVDGVLATRRPARVDREHDLGGKFVVPPFGDAHHHGIDGPRQLDEKVRQFLDAGIFYVKNPNVIPDYLTPEVRAKLNTPESIDVAFSNGGLTRSNGHPVALHATLVKNNVFPGLTEEQMADRAYFLIDSKADLEAKWPRIVAGKPDFIKTFVLFTGTDRQKGLDAEVLREVVKRARANGLRVTSHIETARDFRVALDAGVDEINHLPMPRGNMPREMFLIDDATARRAAKRNVTVVTTVDVHERFGTTMKPEHRTIFIENLQRLLRKGVRVAIGSDGISGELPMATALDEVMNLQKHGYATNLTLLKMWTEFTAATIFPNRKLGRLKDGYEASFLVLEGDPIADFANVQKIALRVKEGRLL